MRELDCSGEWFTYRRLHKSFTKTAFTLLLLCYSQISFGQVTSDFSASTTEGCSPLVVCFTDLSTGNPTSWLWDFGNGNQSPDRNPCAIYIVPGTYTVSLTVSKSGSSDTKTVTNLITVFQDPTANFSASDTLGCSPKTITFTDLSTPGDAAIVSWNWDFGDGNTSTQQNPIANYTNPGCYRVVLFIQDANGCTHEYSVDDLICILPAPTADFEAVPNFSCTYPADITFTNLSSGGSGVTYLWDFGDSQTSAQENPTHTYTSAGSYTVELTITDAAGCSNTKTRADYLLIGALAPDFSASPTSGCGNVNVNFTDQTPAGANITDWYWDFGDGSFSTVQKHFP